MSGKYCFLLYKLDANYAALEHGSYGASKYFGCVLSFSSDNRPDKYYLDKLFYTGKDYLEPSL